MLQRFIERERPRVTLWYHQALRMVVTADGDPALERLYARGSGLPRRALPDYHGTVSSWQNSSFEGETRRSSSSCRAAASTRGAFADTRARCSRSRARSPPRA